MLDPSSSRTIVTAATVVAAKFCITVAGSIFSRSISTQGESTSGSSLLGFGTEATAAVMATAVAADATWPRALVG